MRDPLGPPVIAGAERCSGTPRGPATARDGAVTLVAAGIMALLLGGLTSPASPARSFGAAGVFCDSCPDPLINTFGVEFRHGEMWTLAADGTLTRLDGCVPSLSVSVQGF